jgi:hypothetical protein
VMDTQRFGVTTTVFVSAGVPCAACSRWCVGPALGHKLNRCHRRLEMPTTDRKNEEDLNRSGQSLQGLAISPGTTGRWAGGPDSYITKVNK